MTFRAFECWYSKWLLTIECIAYATMAGMAFYYLFFTTPVRFEGVTVQLLFGIFYTHWLIDSGLKLAADSPALEADEEGIIIRGKWLTTDELTWGEIESIEYTKRLALFCSRRRKDSLIIYLTDTDRIIFEIEQLLESPKDMLLAIEELAPDVLIFDETRYTGISRLEVLFYFR